MVSGEDPLEQVQDLALPQLMYDHTEQPDNGINLYLLTNYKRNACQHQHSPYHRYLRSEHPDNLLLQSAKTVKYELKFKHTIRQAIS